MSTTEHSEEQSKKTEIIAFSSGKGGTGKTLIATCLGYALTKIGLRVLMIDTDTATDGLSLYLLGPSGVDKVKEFPLGSALTGILRQYKEQGNFQFKPWKVNRSMQTDHGVIYEAIISGRQLYGDRFEISRDAANIQLDRDSYRKVIQTMFESLRERAEFDYVIVDTRGGFSDESTDVSALADSYIVVTEADVTSFYQNRNLIQYIDQSASDFGKKAILRSIIVNKSTQFTSTTSDFDLDNLESSFRLQLEREFPIAYKDTHPFPLSFEALTVQKSHKIPLRHALDSDFSYAFLVAFHNILSVVTQPWTKEQVSEWNYLVESVNLAIQKRNEDFQKAAIEEQERDKELEKLRKENSDYINRIASLDREIKEIDERYKREIQRIESFSSKIIPETMALETKPDPKKNTSLLRRLVPAIIGILIIAAIFVFWAMTAAPLPVVPSTSKTIEATQGIKSTETQALAGITETTSVTETPTLQNSATPTPLSTETPTITPISCPFFDTNTAKFPNHADLIAETYASGTVLSAGETFEKKWIIQNTGSKTWNTVYSVAFGSDDSMGGKGPINFSKVVPPSECLEITITMIAPNTPGEHIGNWILLDDQGKRFGFGLTNIGALVVDIIVISPTSTPSPQSITALP